MPDEQPKSKKERPQVKSLLGAFTEAIRSIDPHQVNHPELGVQERVLCYELYHKLRTMETSGASPFAPAKIQAELNKTAQHRVKDTIARLCQLQGQELDWKVCESMPDLLVHVPGTAERNLAVLEAKRDDAEVDDMRWDLAKLALFSAEILHYEYRIFLVFSAHYQSATKMLKQVLRLGTANGPVINVFSLDVTDTDLAEGQMCFSVEAAHALFKDEARKRAEKQRKK
jgi:hypothetical protein